MLFITRIIQNVTIAARTFFGPLTSVFMKARVYMRPGQAIRNQFAGVRAQYDAMRSRMGTFGNSIIPQSWRKRLGMKPPSKRGADGEIGEGEFGELDARKARRLSGGRKLNPLQKQAQFSQIHLIHSVTKEREIAHIGQKVDRSWTEMILSISEEENVRLTYTIVDRSVYGSNVVVTYERGKPDIFVDGTQLTKDISLPLRNESIVQIGADEYVVDMFAYESLPVQTRVDISWITNVGPVRDDNQDAIGLYQHPDGYMFTIADGVGGGYAGDIVSEYSVKYLLKTFQKNIKHSNLSWVDILLKAFRHTNAEVRTFVERSPYPAGTTLTTVVIREWTAYVAHVGDSRVYHLRGTNFTQLTEDHREQHRVVRTTQYEHIPDEYLPMRDVLVRAIGKRDDIDPQMLTFAVQPGDKLLMITDGITHQVSDDELYNILITKTIDDAPDEMVKLANDRENTDNASVILINIMEKAYEQDIWKAVASDRVFVGGKNWRLDLSRPHEMHTQYVLPNQVGCLSFIVLLLACALIWWLPQQMTTNEPNIQPTQAIVESQQLDNPTAVPPTVDVQVVVPSSTIRVEVDVVASDIPQGTLETTQVPVEVTTILTDISASDTPTPIPSATFTPSPSATPLPTRTPFPTIPPTLAPTTTPIPPTSTLRA